MSLAIRLLPETVRSVAFGAISPAYIGIGTAMTRPIRIIMIQNLMDAPLMFSLDGINDHFPLAANGYLLMDITANKTLAQGFFLAEGQRVYASQLNAAPTDESVYLTTFYGAEL